MRQNKPSSEGFKFTRILQSVIAAMFGVQSQTNMEKDFQQKSPYPYIFFGIVFTVLFVLTLIFIVQSIVS